ncbi:MAG: indole-3-glycerol phosphate synthase TrpC [Chitinophagaceae bacterium]|nr:indole-3-glycerol phosphate synthase TrpC [Chitinophagaceae bacterium]
MNILDQIIAYKRSEVADQKLAVSIGALEKTDFFLRDTLSLKQFLLDKNRTGIIAEFKRRSPSKGILNEKSNVADVTAAYAKYGASGLSVLTDNNFFGGSNEDLVTARSNRIPILRKDFMIDEYQIVEAKSIGADTILLIAACLTAIEVKQLAQTAKKLQLEVLLEIHEESEIGHICEEIDVIGVNNRNLKTFSVDLDQSVRLAEKIGTSKLKIAESGISNLKNIAYLKRYGFDGFLIGEYFMKQNDPAEAFEKFVNELKEV